MIFLASIWPFLLAGVLLVLLMWRSGILKNLFAPRAPKAPTLPPSPYASMMPPGPPPPPGAPGPPPGPGPNSPGAPHADDPPGLEPAAASFARTMRFLKENATSSDYRYATPWYLVVGDPDAGKSTVLANAGLNLFEEDERTATPGRNELEWRFLPRGVLLAVPGSYFGSRTGQARDERGWGKLLRLLQSHRGRRPIDGVVLTIPASDLVGPDALEEAHLIARGARYSEMLAQAQRVLGFLFPVYVIVTKCDSIDGFRWFCRELPARNEQDIFGWSNPYQLEATFAGPWVEEAFESLSQDIQRLQSEIFVERTEMTHPDDVFLFPDAFEQMRLPLRLYMERLFHESSYRESFRFRGVYFCGDVSEMVPEVRPVSAPLEMLSSEWPEESYTHLLDAEGTPAPPPAAAGRDRGVKVPIFLKSLFDRKIFPESGIARPLSRVALSRNRMVLAIQGAAVLLALVLGLGTLLAYRRLSNDRAKLLPMLESMMRMPRTAEGERHKLLLDMAPAGDVHFRSPFMPTSWFSPADGDITKVMIYASDRWVLTNLRTSLYQRAQKLLNQDWMEPDPNAAPVAAAAPADAPADQNTTLAPPANVEALAEYQRLERFVTELTLLEENADAYEAIRQRGRIEDVDRIRKLVQYLFASSLAEMQPDGHFAQALAQAQGPPFAVSDEEKNHASDVMRQLVNQLFDSWYGNNLLLADTEDIKNRIADLEQGRTVTYTDLKDVLTSIKQMEGDFSSPNFKWIDNSRLDLTGPFRRVIQAPISASQNRFLNPDVLDYSKRLGEDHLRQLRTMLAEEQTGLTGPMLDVKETVQPSAGTRSLQLALENALNLRFMSQAASRTIRTNLDPTTRLMWRIEPLQEALRLNEIYSRFVDEGLRDSPSRLRTALSRVALEQLKRNDQDLIAQSEDFQPRPLTRERQAEEDETLPEVNSFREAEEPLVQLSTKFRQLGMTDLHNAVLRVMGLQSWNLLGIIDRRLSDEDPYAAKEGNFGWWNGKPSLALASYEVRNSSELAEYLTTQRERLKFLEQQAEPLVLFLNASFPTRGEDQNRLVTKWQRIIADFHQYDGKKPGASLTALEDFILNDMDKILPETACAGAPAGRDAREQNLDYFLQIRSTLRQAIYDRCQTLGAEGATRTYTEIAELFNKNLAGQFPFAALGRDRTQSEVTPEAVLDFYKLLDKNEKAARTTLQENPRFGQTGRAALKFLEDMDNLRALVVSGGPDAEKEPPFTMEFTPKFRVNTPREVGGNQVIEWTMQVGGQIFRQREPEHPGRWRVGNPIRLSLRWANDSLYVPQAESGQPNLRIYDRNAVYEFVNRWSLISFLRRQEAPASDVTPSNDTKPYLLRFRIRTVLDQKWANPQLEQPAVPALVYMQMRVQPPGAKASIVLPPFPYRAPALEAPTGSVATN